MSNPDDDTDVPSGFDDDARMERTPSRSSETAIDLALHPMTEARNSLDGPHAHSGELHHTQHFHVSCFIE